MPCGVLRSAGEALLSPEAVERGLVFALPHPVAGRAPAIAQPVQYSDTPCQYGTPPVLGQHTRHVLGGILGYPDEKLAELDAAGAIGFGAVET